MSHPPKRLFGAVLPILLALCAAVTPAQAAAMSAALANGTAPVDVTVNPVTRKNASTKVPLGQTIAVTRPEDYDEWQVDFDAAALSALTPLEKMRAPGLQGWLFRAIKPGITQIMLTSLLPPCSRALPCPHLNPQRFAITLEVQP
jgi:hypothetical protein